MNYATIKYYDIANGPGVRTSIFVSGCRHHCPGCFNEVAWDFGYGQPFDKAVRNEIFASCQPDYIAGISLLGGHGHDGGRARIALKHGSFGNSQRVEIPDIAAADGALRAVQQEPDSGFHSGIFPDNRGVLAVFDFYGIARQTYDSLGVDL